MLIYSKLLSVLHTAYKWAIVGAWTILCVIRGDSWASLPSDAPEGTIAFPPRLCGNGRFMAIRGATRWEVAQGNSVISDAAGYDLTASGTSFVSLAAYTIPAGMIGDGEEWFAFAQMRNNGTWTSGSDTVQVRFQSLSTNGTLLGTAAAGAASRVARGEGRFTRFGTTLIRNTGGVTYSNASSADQTLDLSVDRVIEAGITPGASGNTVRLRHWSVGRCA